MAPLFYSAYLIPREGLPLKSRNPLPALEYYSGLVATGSIQISLILHNLFTLALNDAALVHLFYISHEL